MTAALLFLLALALTALALRPRRRRFLRGYVPTLTHLRPLAALHNEE